MCMQHAKSCVAYTAGSTFLHKSIYNIYMFMDNRAELKRRRRTEETLSQSVRIVVEATCRLRIINPLPRQPLPVRGHWSFGSLPLFDFCQKPLVTPSSFPLPFSSLHRHIYPWNKLIFISRLLLSISNAILRGELDNAQTQIHTHTHTHTHIVEYRIYSTHAYKSL